VTRLPYLGYLGSAPTPPLSSYSLALTPRLMITIVTTCLTVLMLHPPVVLVLPFLFLSPAPLVFFPLLDRLLRVGAEDNATMSTMMTRRQP
jgi:hypothetical protein